MTPSALICKSSSPDSACVNGPRLKQVVVAFQNSPKPLTSVAKDVLAVSDSCHRNCLNLVFVPEETLTNSKNSQQMVVSTISGSSDGMSLNYLEIYSNPLPSRVCEIIYQVCMAW